MSFAIQRLRELRASHAMLPASAHDAPASDSSIAPSRWDDPVVAEARREAARLGVLDHSFSAGGSSAPQWLGEPEWVGLPEFVQELVCPRVGWTPSAWAKELQRKASLCETMHPDVAARYEIAAGLLLRSVGEKA